MGTGIAELPYEFPKRTAIGRARRGIGDANRVLGECGIPESGSGCCGWMEVMNDPVEAREGNQPVLTLGGRQPKVQE